jgi:hypothetical protein
MVMSGIQIECEIQKAVKQHLLDCLKRPEYYNYPHADLVSDYTTKIEKIDKFLEMFDK